MNGAADRPPGWRWAKVVGMEFCGSYPTWIAIAAGLLGIVTGWVVVSLIQGAVTHA